MTTHSGLIVAIIHTSNLQRRQLLIYRWMIFADTYPVVTMTIRLRFDGRSTRVWLLIKGH